MENKIPTLASLHHDVEEAYKNDGLKLLLNQPPHSKWLKRHPIYGNTYLPIDKIEYLLDRIFQQWQIEILREGVVLNSCYISVRLHYIHPISGQWLFHDGIGAKSLQLDEGCKPSELNNIKDSAVMLAMPIAKSFAIKDAAEHFGKLFGRDLNRKDTVEFKGSYTEKSEAKLDKVTENFEL